MSPVDVSFSCCVHTAPDLVNTYPPRRSDAPAPRGTRGMRRQRALLARLRGSTSATNSWDTALGAHGGRGARPAGPGRGRGGRPAHLRIEPGIPGRRAAGDAAELLEEIRGSARRL